MALCRVVIVECGLVYVGDCRVWPETDCRVWPETGKDEERISKVE